MTKDLDTQEGVRQLCEPFIPLNVISNSPLKDDFRSDGTYSFTKRMEGMSDHYK